MEFGYKKIEVPQPPPPPVLEEYYILTLDRNEFRALVAVSALVAGNPVESPRRLFDRIYQHGVAHGYRRAMEETKIEGKITFPNGK